MNGNYSDNIIKIIVNNIAEKEIPDNIEVSFYSGRNYWVYKKSKQTGRFYDKEYLLQLFKTVHSQYYMFDQRIKKMLAKEQYRMVVRVCDSALVNVDSEIAYEYRGLAHYKLLDTISALSDFLRALTINNKNSETYLNVAIILGEFAGPKRALKYIDTALTLNASNAKAIYYRAEFRLATGDTVGACDDMNAAKEMGFINDNTADTKLFLICTCHIHKTSSKSYKPTW